jgi:hypothetical protein
MEIVENHPNPDNPVAVVGRRKMLFESALGVTALG